LFYGIDDVAGFIYGVHVGKTSKWNLANLHETARTGGGPASLHTSLIEAKEW
jgi:hypothetical protein